MQKSKNRIDWSIISSLTVEDISVDYLRQRRGMEYLNVLHFISIAKESEREIQMSIQSRSEQIFKTFKEHEQ